MYYLHPYGGEYEQEFGEKGVEDVERLFDMSVLATIPYNTKQKTKK